MSEENKNATEAVEEKKMDNDNIEMTAGERKIAIVTGANQGIGRSIAKRISSIKDSNDKEYIYEAVIICRNKQKGEQTIKDLQKETGNTNIHLITCDISSYRTVQNIFVKQIMNIITNKNMKCSIILVNNAAECPMNRSLNSDGIERQFATNVLGYHFMMRSIFGYLIDNKINNKIKNIFYNFINCKSSRIVNVASNWAGDLDINDLQFKKRKYDNDTAYRQSKQCDRMLNYIWSVKLKQFGILVNSCHPGDPCTTLSKSLGYNLYSTKNCDICKSPVYLAIDDKVNTTGGWFESDCNVRKERFAQNKQLCAKLFDVCESFCV
eukprot:534116_1